MSLTIQSISAANGTIGTDQTLKINYSTSGQTTITAVDWYLTYKNTNGGDQSHATVYMAGTSYTLHTDPAVIGPNLTNAKFTTFTARVIVSWAETTNSVGGGAPITITGASTKSTTFTMTFKESDVKINSQFGIAPVNSNGWSGYISGLSKIRASRSNTTLKYGASLKSWTVKLGNAAAVSVSTSATTYDSVIQPISASAYNVAVVITVTDSRGYSISSTLSASFVPYQNPSLTANAIRTNSGGTAAEDGTYMKISASSLIAKCSSGNTQQNGVTVQYRYKKGSAGSFTGYTTIPSSGSADSGATNRSYSYNNVLVNLGADSVDYAYTVEVVATDSLGKKATRSIVINSEPWAMSIYQGGRGVAFGMKQDRTKRLTIPDDWRYYRGDHKIIDDEGGTVSGDITMISGARVITRNPTIDGTAGSITEQTDQIFALMQDKNANMTSFLYTRQEASNGRISTRLGTVRPVNGSNMWNTLELYVAANGDRSIAVSDSAAWRAAIFADTGWQTFPLSSDFEAYSTNYVPKYRVINGICYLTGIIKPKTTLTYAGGPYTIGTLPSGARHTLTEMYFLGQSNGQRRFDIQILASGEVKIDRYGITSGENYGAGQMIAFTVQFPVG